MTGQLAGRTALVTGASRGIGRAIALAYAEAGADLILAARGETDLHAVAAEVAEHGARAYVVPTDVTDGSAVRRLVDSGIEHFGRIDVLVNNSGVLSSASLVDTEEAEWDRVINTNLRGVYLLTRAVGKHLIDQGGGKVINIASNFAFQGVARHAAYVSSKAAVLAFTRSMAVEWARHDIQVNALAPGYFSTDLNADARADEQMYERIVRGIPAKRMGDVSELGPWAVLLASSASDFMTGETVVIDGGQAAR